MTWNLESDQHERMEGVSMDAQVRSGGYEGFMELCSAVPLPGFKGTELCVRYYIHRFTQ